MRDETGGEATYCFDSKCSTWIPRRNIHVNEQGMTFFTCKLARLFSSLNLRDRYKYIVQQCNEKFDFYIFFAHLFPHEFFHYEISLLLQLFDLGKR